MSCQMVHTWLESVVKNFVNRLDILVRWCMKDDDERAEEAECTSDSANMTEFFVEEE